MATLRELIYNIKSNVRGGVITDDDKISDRQVGFIVDSIRATLLRQSYDKGQSLSDNHIQRIKCLSVEPVDQSFDSTFNLDCQIYKSSRQLPKFIESKFKDLITKIAPTEFGSIGFEIVPYARVPYVFNTRFSRPIATLYNQYVYVLGSGYIEKINVDGVIESPNDLSNYSDCDGVTCFNWDSPYPLSGHLVDILTRMAIQELQPESTSFMDKVNDATQLNQGK